MVILYLNLNLEEGQQWNTVILNQVEHGHFSIFGTWSFLNFWNTVILKLHKKKINLNLEEGQPKQFGTLFHKKLLSTEQNLNLKLEEGQLEFPIHEIQSIFKVKLEI